MNMIGTKAPAVTALMAGGTPAVTMTSPLAAAFSTGVP